MSKWRPSKKDCIYVIPDIHGSLELLQNVCNRILPLRKSDGGIDRLVILGDFIDRHIDSHKVVDFLLQLEKDYPDQVVFLMGNHELMLLQALNKMPGRNMSLASMSTNYQMWLKNGGWDTLSGYLLRSGTQEVPWEFPRSRVESFIPKEHIDFFQRLKPYYQIDNFIFVHGGIDPLIPPEKQDMEVLVWDRSLLKYVLKSLETQKPLPWGPVVVTGHNVLSNKKPVITDKFLMLDCGSPKQLLVTEVRSRQAYMAYPNQARLVKYPLSTTKLDTPIFRRASQIPGTSK